MNITNMITKLEVLRDQMGDCTVDVNFRLVATVVSNIDPDAITANALIEPFWAEGRLSTRPYNILKRHEVGTTQI